MEELILLIVPILSALVASQVFRHQIIKIDVGIALIVGIVSWLLGPRCLCTKIHDGLVGSLLFAIVFGVGIFFLFHVTCSGWKRIRKK
jgi:hypothetical protein